MTLEPGVNVYREEWELKAPTDSWKISRSFTRFSSAESPLGACNFKNQLGCIQCQCQPRLPFGNDKRGISGGLKGRRLLGDDKKEIWRSVSIYILRADPAAIGYIHSTIPIAFLSVRH